MSAGLRWGWVLVAAGLLGGVANISNGASQRLLVSSFFADRVGEYDLDNGAFVGDFAATDLNGVLAARVGPDGLLYVASELTNEVVRYRLETGERIDTFIDGSGNVPLDGPSGFDWAPNGDFYVSSFNNDSILRFDGTSGDYLAQVVGPGGLVNGPDNGTVFGPDGKLYIPSYFNNRIVTYDPATGSTSPFISSIFRPRVLVFHEDQLYVTSETTRSVRRYTTDGDLVDVFIEEPLAVIGQPVGLAYHEGDWLVSSASLDKVLRFDAAGDLIDADFIGAGAGGADGPVFLTVVNVPETGSGAGVGSLLVFFWLSRKKPNDSRNFRKCLTFVRNQIG